MDISAYTTQQTATGKPAAAGQGGAAASGIFAEGTGLNFMDLIFARVTAALQQPQEGLSEATAQSGADAGAQASPAGNGGDPLLTPGQVVRKILEGDLKTLEQLAADIEAATGAPGKSGHREKIADLLRHLARGLPAQPEAPAGIETDIITGAANGAASDETTPALIATGLTPERLTEILRDLTDSETPTDAILIGIVKILPPQARREAVFLPRGILLTAGTGTAGSAEAAPATVQDAALAAKLNGLTVGGETEAGAGADAGEPEFDDLLKVLEFAQGKGQKNGNALSALDAAIERAAGRERPSAGAGLSAIQGAIHGAPPAPAQMVADFGLGDIFPEGWDFAPGTGNTHGLTLTGPGALTSLVGHAPQAGMPHPATQAVASVIAKASANGENRNITIQLDPPDLGKVSVRLEFGKEKGALKALIIAEKPETFLMLQRDAHMLERALQASGLEADGGLSFELSQDGSAFAHDHHDTGGNSGGAGEKAENAESETGTIIETRMDWYVDPATGLTRYDALV